MEGVDSFLKKESLRGDSSKKWQKSRLRLLESLQPYSFHKSPKLNIIAVPTELFSCLLKPKTPPIEQAMASTKETAIKIKEEPFSPFKTYNCHQIGYSFKAEEVDTKNNNIEEIRDQLYKNRSSWKIDFQRLFSRE